MPSCPPRILYVTDLGYQARGRRYCDEDIWLSARLRRDFTPALCHPLDTTRLMGAHDAVVVRNSGPVLGYWPQYQAFRDEARAAGVRVYNSLDGHADMLGKGYLLQLSEAGYPVIPTVAAAADAHRLPDAAAYVVKPRLGSDSIGMRVVPKDRLTAGDFDGDVVVQPHVPIRYEVSFCFVDHDFQYALYTPDPEHRWQLAPYAADAADLAFARRFVEWNALGHGIQRVDACRTEGGDLLLVELEDLNPYLSLDAVDPAVRDAFADRMADALRELLR